MQVVGFEDCNAVITEGGTLRLYATAPPNAVPVYTCTASGYQTYPGNLFPTACPDSRPIAKLMGYLSSVPLSGSVPVYYSEKLTNAHYQDGTPFPNTDYGMLLLNDSNNGSAAGWVPAH